MFRCGGIGGPGIRARHPDCTPAFHQRSSQMETKDYETIGDPNDSRSATQDPQPPSGDRKAADPDTNSDANSCPPPDAKAVLVTLPAQQSEEHTSELQSLRHLVCRLLLENAKI